MIQTQLTEGGYKTLIDVAIDRLQAFEPKNGYYLAFSGGKDSITVYRLMELAKVKFDAHYNWTTIDPPELKKYIEAEYPDVEIHQPDTTMWELMKKKRVPPNRWTRYCCSELKEGGGEGRFVVTGVRWAESIKRRKNRKYIEFDSYGSQSKKAIAQREIFQSVDQEEKRRMIETCTTKGKNILNPIIEWSDKDVWDFIHSQKIKYCSLYDDGWDRIGCIGCPLTTTEKRRREFERYPKHQRAFIRTFQKMIDVLHDEGHFLLIKDGEEAFDIWLEKGYWPGDARVEMVTTEQLKEEDKKD